MQRLTPRKSPSGKLPCLLLIIWLCGRLTASLAQGGMFWICPVGNLGRNVETRDGSVPLPPEGAGRMPALQRARRPRYESRPMIICPAFNFYVAHPSNQLRAGLDPEYLCGIFLDTRLRCV